MELADRIRTYIDGAEAERLLRKYHDGRYTGSLYDELGSPDPDRITSEDIAAVALLSVELSGSAVKALLWTHADAISQRLARISSTPLQETSETDLQPLWELQDYFSNHVRNVGIGHVRRSKILAHKRPHLIPIRDRYVLKALAGDTSAALTLPLRQALQSDPGIPTRLEQLATAAGRPRLSVIRTLDVIVWMAEVGDAQISG